MQDLLIPAMNSTIICAPNGDNVFGPQVEPCLRSFDFTLQFENIVFSVVPSAIFLSIAPIRLYFLRNARKRVVGGSAFQISKLVGFPREISKKFVTPLKSVLRDHQLVIALFATLQLGLLILWSLDHREGTAIAIAAATLSLVDALIFCFLSYVEHGKNLRPSAVLGVYLLFSVLFDIVRIRTLWLIGEDSNVARLFTTSLVLKCGILFLEAREKRDYLRPEDRMKGPEELSGILNKSVFYWLNQLLTTGYRKILSLEDLYPLDEKLEAKFLGSKFANVWNTCKQFLPKSCTRGSC